jgi:hypothetical protein
MPAPAYRSFVKTEIFTASNVGGSGTTVTLTKPSGTVSGDVLIAAMNNIGASRSVTTIPSGWTLIKEELVATSPAVGLWVFKKVAGGSEPASYDFVFNYDFNGSGGIVAYSGGADVSVTGAVTTTSGGSSPYTVTAPAVTTPDNDSLLVWIGTLNVPTPTAAATFTAPSGYTKRWEQSTSYNNAAITMADDELATAGSSGAASGSVANASGGTSNALGLLVAIAPTGGASTIAASGSGEVPEIRAVSLVPTSLSTLVGNTADATITVLDQDGAPIESLTGTMSTSAAGVATVAQLAVTNALGQATMRATAVGVGAADLKATFDGIESNVIRIDVASPPTTGAVVITPTATALQTGQSAQFLASVDVANPVITWSVASGGGTVTATGLYTAGAAGTSVVRATYAPLSIFADATVFVTAPPSTFGTVVSSWKLGGSAFANQTITYDIKDPNGVSIASGTTTTDSTGAFSVQVPADYVGTKVNVVISTLDITMSIANRVQGQHVVTVL